MGGGDCAEVGSPQPGDLLGNRHVLTGSESIPSSQRAPVQLHHPWLLRIGGWRRGLKEPKQPQADSHMLLALEPSADFRPGPDPLRLQALVLWRLGRGPETFSWALVMNCSS
jgi:hypothetical protein